MDYNLIYMSSLAMTVTALAFLYISNLKNWKGNYFNTLSFVYILIMISAVADIVWKPIDGIAEKATLNYVVNCVEYITLSFSAYLWFVYTCQTGMAERMKSRKIQLLCGIPIFIVSLLIITTRWTGWLFTIDANGFYHRGTYFIIQQFGYVYMAASVIVLLYSGRSVTFTIQKKKYISMLKFHICPIVLGLLQIMMPPSAMPTLHFSLFLSLLIVYTDEQDRRITRDTLTGLSNRYEFERKLSEKIEEQRRGESGELYVLMGDLDHFKQINDIYGHIEGDRALRIVGRVLENVADSYDCSVARLGGDEFACVLRADSEYSVKEFIFRINDELEINSRNERFDLEFSFGYSSCGDEQTILQMLDNADRDMYRVKKAKYM